MRTSSVVKIYLHSNYNRLKAAADIDSDLKSTILSFAPKADLKENSIEKNRIEMIAAREELEAIYEALPRLSKRQAWLIANCDLENDDDENFTMTVAIDDYYRIFGYSDRTFYRHLNKARIRFAEEFKYVDLTNYDFQKDKI